MRRRDRSSFRISCFLLAAGLAGLALSGCATRPALEFTERRAFDFKSDTLAYPNALVWDYHFNPTNGQRMVSRREPPPDYTHHCFVVVRVAAQFHVHARFDATLPPPDGTACRGLIREVMRRSPRTESPPKDRVIIPGYASLHAFSAAWEPLLKAECGGAWQSYFQRGHWRMVVPFTRGQQEETALNLWSAVRARRAPVIHIVKFPQLTINHALLVFGATPTRDEIRFDIYDPNHHEKPEVLTFHRKTRTFTYPPKPYFWGGVVDIYEIYHGWNY